MCGLFSLNFFLGFYCRDRWNVFDFLTFVVYIFAILPLRIAIWVESESVNNNRILAIAGYLYGVNTMFLTLRAFGSLLETTKGVGTVQIAFFSHHRGCSCGSGTFSSNNGGLRQHHN